MLEDKTDFIWLPEAADRENQNRLALFQKKLQLKEIPKEVPIRISADARYKLYVNGQFVCCGPCKGDQYRRYYETVDIAPYLTEGNNVLLAKVLRYGSDAESNVSVYQGIKPFFYLKEEKTRLGLDSDDTYKCILAEGFQMVSEVPEGETSGFYLYNSERVNAAFWPSGCMSASYDDTDWNTAAVYTIFDIYFKQDGLSLTKRPIPLMFHKKKYFQNHCDFFKNISAHSVYTFVLDAGEIETGYPVYSFSGGKGAVVSAVYAESYFQKDENGNLIKKDRTDAEHGFLYGHKDIYQVGGFGDEKRPEQYESFWFRTFRFVELTVQTQDEPLTLFTPFFLETGYPLEVRTQVQIPDKTMESIYDICLRSLKRCMHETYEDCPYYEQLQYAMDTRAQMLFTYTLAADDRMARRTLDDFHRSLRPEGLTNCCYPTKRKNIIPGFSCFYVYMLYDHMMYFGDKQLVLRYFHTIENILDYFHRHLEEHQIVGHIGSVLATHEHWSFIDWAPEYTLGVPTAEKAGPITMESMLYLLALLYAAELAEYVGKREAQQEYIARSRALKNAIRTSCYDEKLGLYMDGPGYTALYSEHPQVFAVLCGLEEGKSAAELLNRMEQYEKSHQMAKCTVAMSFYKFRAYQQAGLYEKTKDFWEPWKEMLANHMTTCVENPLDGRSDCHAWGASALYELPSAMLGVRPAAPGYAKAYVAPEACFWSELEGTVVTPRGPIHVRIDAKGETQRLVVQAEQYQGDIIRCE